MEIEVRRRRERIHELIRLARSSRRMSRARLARALQRDVSRLYPETANPKLDFLASLAELLGWPLGAVIEYIWQGMPRDPDGERTAEDASSDYDEVLDATRDALRYGEYHKTIQLARRLQRLARTPRARAVAVEKEANALSYMGCVDRAIALGQRSLALLRSSSHTFEVAQANHTSVLIDAGHYAGALGLVDRMLLRIQRHPGRTRREHLVEAFVYFLRGRAHGCLIEIEPDLSRYHAEQAVEAMRISQDMHERYADVLGMPELNAVADTCRAGIVAAEVELGQRDAEDVVGEMIASLPTTLDDERYALGDWLECCGWWCVTGARLALRHMEGAARAQAIAVFNNKALEIADQCDNWLFRQHVLRIRYEAHRQVVAQTGLRIDWMLDDEDVRLVVGVMGRSSRFRELGWQMLQEAGRAAG